MVLGATTAAAAATGGSLFEYNRQNFQYDRRMRQITEYQIMDFRIKQAELWREDVKDIIGLTSVKMDTYLIVTAVQLGFCVMCLCEGRLAPGTPVWLVGCHTLSLSGAFMYLLMSVWLAMHASVTAKSYEVRLLTQLVRLPIPSWAQLEGARTYGSAFEKIEPKQMFRVPFGMGTQESVLQSSTSTSSEAEQPGSSSAGSAAAPHERIREACSFGADPPTEIGPAEAPAPCGQAQSADVWGLEGRGDTIYELDGTVRSDPKMLSHLRLVRESMQYWQAYDGFARVAMSIGTNQLVGALAYYVIGYVLISNHAVIAALLVVILFMVLASALIRLDISLTSLDYRISVVLVVSGPCLTALAAEQWSRHTAVGYQAAAVLTPIAYMAHAMWLMFLLYISNVKEQKDGALLPTGFRSVMFIDVFGWIKRQRQQNGRRLQASNSVPVPPPADAAAQASGNGPAMQAVQYIQGRPVPTRPEELLGAAQSKFALESLKREDFEPTTFVPREKEENSPEANITYKKYGPGVVPWKIFCASTVLLIMLWWITGMLVLLDSCGIHPLKVSALLEHSGFFVALEQSSAQATLLQSAARMHLPNGQHIPTSWPLASIQPHGLSCSDSAGGMLVSSSRFGLFTARLKDRADGESVEFKSEPPCEDTEGESLRDVTLSCEGALSAGDCHALVLHRQGQRLSACRLSNFGAEQIGAGNASASLPSMMNLADAWLGVGNSATGVLQEEVTSIALADHCRGAATGVGSRCAFVETSSKRIVEVQTGFKSNGAGKPDWIPTRILQAESGGVAREGGALHLIAGQYLGILQRDAQELLVLDPQDGTALGQWRLPGDHVWGAMCSRGNSLYFLTEGESPAPQLWRFPMPEQLWPRHGSAGTASAAQEGRQRAPARTLIGRNRQSTLAATA